MGTTAENLLAAAEASSGVGALYPASPRWQMRRFCGVAESFHGMASRVIRTRLQAARQRERVQGLQEGRVVLWKCRNCGYVYERPGPEEPSCKHPQAY
jgi:rubrerythrin